jgi:DeoR/GlpR family transcriptional regulator of sugar metabolism
MGRPMLAVDRRLRILEQVADDQSIQVSDLAARFGVSEMTIRRDIRRLERDGFLKRTYGGATAHLTRSLDLAFNARALLSARETRLIGMTAAGLIGDATTIYAGIGTTVEQFARYLPARPEITVVTGSVVAASLLGTRPVRTVILGGVVRHDELTCVGPIAVDSLGRYRFDLAVIGAAAVSARWGISEGSDDDAEVNRIAIARSERTVVLAHGGKIGATASSVVGPVEDVDMLVTDPSAPPDELRRLRDVGVDVTIATAGNDPAHAAAAADRRT